MGVGSNETQGDTDMTREQAIPYIGHYVDDALSPRHANEMPAHARLIGWQCGFEPMFVAVWSYLPDNQPDYAEAIEIATDYLEEKQWFSGEATDPDYVF